MSRLQSIALAVLLAAGMLATPAQATTLFYDLGDDVTQTAGYNNMNYLFGPVANSIDDAGTPTGISLTLSDTLKFYNMGPNRDGTQAPTGDAAQFAVAATRDSLFGSEAPFNGVTSPHAQLLLAGLNPNLTYDFTFFASRMGVSDNREAQYAVTGLTTASALLNAANNVSNVAVVAGIQPDANGLITLDVTPGPNNTNGSKFYYLGAMRIDYVPEPATCLLLLLGSATLLRRRA